MGFVSPCSSAPASIIYFLTSINIYLIKKSTNQNTAGDKTANDMKRLRAIQKLEKNNENAGEMRSWRDEYI